MFVSGRGAIAQVQYTGDEAPAEIKQLLDAVVENEDELEKWEALLNRALELEGGVTRNSSPSAIELVRNVYDCFLAKFPLLFAYWKKYGIFEFSIGGTETAEMVYERGVASIPKSVDLWEHYCEFKMNTCHDNDAIRELFERGAHFVGLDFQAHPFWEKYLEFEQRIQETANTTKLHARLVEIPLYQFNRYYDKYRQFLSVRPLEELATTEQLEDIRSALRTETPGIEQSTIEFDRAIRTKLDENLWQINTRVSAQVQVMWKYEQNIKRPYFTVTEMEDAELANWREYLDHEEKNEDDNRIMFLYERCLIPCALYDEFWHRYARWLSSKGKDEDARLIYMRASCIFVPISRPSIRLNWARFEEKLGRIQVARDIHVSVLDQIPDHVETIVSLAGVERRHEGNETAIQLLDDYINNRDVQVGGFLAAEQARIKWQCMGAVAEARQIFQDKHEKFLVSKEFWARYLKFEAAQPQVDSDEAHARVKAVHDTIRTKGALDVNAKKELSQYYMDYLLARGGKEVSEEYMKIDREVNGGNIVWFPEIHLSQPEQVAGAVGRL